MEGKLRALLVHGWNDDPSTGWFGWLAARLSAAGYEVSAPHFEDMAPQRLHRWQEQLAEEIPFLDERTIIVAHSLGCWLTLRLIEGLPTDQRIRATYLVAGFFDAPRPEATSYFEPEPDWTRIIPHVGERVCLYSNDDRIVLPDRTRRLAHRLEAELVCVPEHGHFLGSRGMNDFPELYELIATSSSPHA